MHPPSHSFQCNPRFGKGVVGNRARKIYPTVKGSGTCEILAHILKVIKFILVSSWGDITCRIHRMKESQGNQNLGRHGGGK